MDSTFCASGRSTSSPFFYNVLLRMSSEHIAHTLDRAGARNRQPLRGVQRKRRDLADHLQEHLDTFHWAMFSDFTNNLPHIAGCRALTIVFLISFEISSCQSCMWYAMSQFIFLAKADDCHVLERSINLECCLVCP